VFSKKVRGLVWPHLASTQFYYIVRGQWQTKSFDFSLFEPLTPAEVDSLKYFFRQHHLSDFDFLVPDSFRPTRSFVYDIVPDKISPQEIKSLAADYIDFAIDPDLISTSSATFDKKTVVTATFSHPKTIPTLDANLAQLTPATFHPFIIGQKLASIIFSKFQPQNSFFIIYPLEKNQFLVSLNRQDKIYLSQIVKGVSFDLKKILNYSKLLFGSLPYQIFAPSSFPREIFQDHIDKVVDLPQESPDQPIFISTSKTSLSKSDQPVIIDKTTMEENKPNLLPIIAVFIVSASIISIVLWLFLNRSTDEVNPNVPDSIPTTSFDTVSPTQIPTPTLTVTDIDKNLKIQVLNATDINGQAATLKAELVKLGFTQISVGNAKEPRTTNLVRYQPTQKDAVTYFKSALADSFPAEYQSDLTATSSYDLIFVIGTDLKAKTTPVSSTTPTQSPSVSPTPTQ